MKKEKRQDLRKEKEKPVFIYFNLENK